MPRFDATQAECHVFAYKEGLLSAVGHDVKLQVTRFEVSIDGDRVEATFDPDSLRVIGAVRDGRDDPHALSAADKDTILGYVRKDILESHRFKSITFTANGVDDDGGDTEIDGELELHGQRRPIAVRARQVGDRWVAKVKINQGDFGIRPFKALMGALKIKPVVEVELRLPGSALEGA